MSKKIYRSNPFSRASRATCVDVARYATLNGVFDVENLVTPLPLV
jgi:hypothetical protein